MGVTDYEPRVVQQLLEYAYREPFKIRLANTRQTFFAAWTEDQLSSLPGTGQDTLRTFSKTLMSTASTRRGQQYKLVIFDLR